MLLPGQTTFTGSDGISFELMNLNGYAVQIDGVDAYQVSAGDKKAIVANAEDSAWLQGFMSSVENRENAKASVTTVGKIVEKVVVTLLKVFGAAALAAVVTGIASFIGVFVLTLAFVGLSLAAVTGALTIAMSAAIAGAASALPVILTFGALVGLGIGVIELSRLIRDRNSALEKIGPATTDAIYDFNTLSSASYVKVRNWTP